MKEIIATTPGNTKITELFDFKPIPYKVTKPINYIKSGSAELQFKINNKSYLVVIDLELNTKKMTEFIFDLGIAVAFDLNDDTRGEFNISNFGNPLDVLNGVVMSVWGFINKELKEYIEEYSEQLEQRFTFFLTSLFFLGKKENEGDMRRKNIYSNMVQKFLTNKGFKIVSTKSMYPEDMEFVFTPYLLYKARR